MAEPAAEQLDGILLFALQPVSALDLFGFAKFWNETGEIGESHKNLT